VSIEDLLPGQEGLEDKHIYGVVIAVVTGNQDPEGLGRIKINFPWRGENDESHWARMISPMAGNERGIVFYPEVDDEVLVAFEHGDINEPYVIGALWNGKDKPPETNSDGKNNIRMIKSRSGHEIIFNDDDSSGKEKIEINTKGKHQILLDDSSGEEKIEINTKGKHKILLDDSSGKEKIEISTKGKHKISLDDSSGQEKIEIVDKTGSNKIKIDSNQNSIDLESAMKLKIKSNMIEIEGTASITIKSDGVLTVKGSMVKIN
jgi:uncharacterized protein involved in type VI secretion and phage assembly